MLLSIITYLRDQYPQLLLLDEARTERITDHEGGRPVEAQILIEQWRQYYNTVRPHSALGYRPPAPETIIPMDHRPVMH